MPFQSSQTSRIYVGILPTSAYTRSVSTASSNAVHDSTVLTDTARQFIVGKESASFSVDGPLDVDASQNGQWDALTDQKQSDTPTPVTWMPVGTAGAAWLVGAIDTNFATTSGVGSTVDWSMSASTTGAPDVGVILENETTVTIDTDGSTHTGPVGGTANGGVAHLHVSAYSGLTSDDIIIEQSTSGAFAGEETTLLSFTQVTGLTSERVEVTGTVARYLRVVDNVTGTGSITHHVAFARR